MALTVIDGSQLQRGYQKGAAKQKVCSRCEEQCGVATSLWCEATAAPVETKGVLSGGQKVLVCVYCLAYGRVTTL